MPKKILIADDDQNTVSFLVSLLKANKYEVVVAFDGMQTIAVAHKEKPDLILLDIMMPVRSGINIFENLKMSALTATTPVIFITGVANPEIKQKALEMGAADYIVKPFETEYLLSKVRKALGEKNRV
ncbi:MAG TPA: response regulator [Smithellaceae bacterium]|jgi:DNA-binding response OmpR family regulator